MIINRLLLNMLKVRGLATSLQERADDVPPETFVQEALGISDPGCRVRSVWNADKEALELRRLDLPPAPNGMVVSYRLDDLDADETNHVIAVSACATYPATVAMSLVGRPFDEIVRHDDIIGLGFVITGVKRLAVGGMAFAIAHPQGMMVQTS